MTAPENEKGLVRQLSLLDATMIVIGSMIGSGIFLTSAESSRLVGAPGWLLIAWLLAGVMTITGALCLAELAAMMPQAERPYRTWGYPVVPAIFLILSVLLIVNLAFLAPTTSGVGYLLTLTGIPVYFIWRRVGTKKTSMQASNN